MARKKGKTLKQVVLEVLTSPMSLDELVKKVKSKRPRTRVRVIKALLSRLVKEGSVKFSNGKYSK